MAIRRLQKKETARWRIAADADGAGAFHARKNSSEPMLPEEEQYQSGGRIQSGNILETASVRKRLAAGGTLASS